MLSPGPSPDPTLPFTVDQAAAAGITENQLRGRRFRRVLGGVYAVATVPDSPLLRAQAVLLVHPAGAVVSHGSAARLVGAPVPHDPDEHVTVERAADRRHRQGVRCHVASLAADEVRVLGGIRITAPHRLFLDLAGALGLVDLVVLGDWLVRRGYVRVETLVEYCARQSRPHARAARRAAAYVRDRVDSPMETRLRMLIVLAGLPEPVVNHELRDPWGTLLRRLDLSWPGLSLALEYDGRHHYSDAEQWESDVLRREELGDEAWRLMTVTAKQIYRQPELIVERVYRALKQRGCPGLRRPTDAWRRHFAR